MNDWFSWNGKKCTEYGIHVLEQPPITIPAERATFTNIPGRPGSLTTLEGDDVYDDLILTAQCMISDPSSIRFLFEGKRESRIRQQAGRLLFCPNRESDSV